MYKNIFETGRSSGNVSAFFFNWRLVSVFPVGMQCYSRLSRLAAYRQRWSIALASHFLLGVILLLLASPVTAQSPSGMSWFDFLLYYVVACLVNWQYTVVQSGAGGSAQSQTVDACVGNAAVLLLNVFLWFAIWFVATWLVMLSTQSC